MDRVCFVKLEKHTYSVHVTGTWEREVLGLKPENKPFPIRPAAVALDLHPVADSGVSAGGYVQSETECFTLTAKLWSGRAEI